MFETTLKSRKKNNSVSMKDDIFYKTLLLYTDTIYWIYFFNIF